MKARLVLIAALGASGILAATHLQTGSRLVTPAQAECVPGTRLDKTTVEQIRDKLIKAGYKNPLHLRKGCDNAWHGTATKQDAAVNVAITPDGHIVEEGD